MFLTYKLQISFKFDFLSPANEQTISSSTCSLQCSDSCRLLPKSETCCARHTGTSFSKRCLCAGNKQVFPYMKNWYRDEAVYPRLCWKFEAGTGVNPNLHVLTQNCAHFSVWKGWTPLNWKCTFGLSPHGRTVLWDGHQCTSVLQRSGFGQTLAPAPLLLPWGSMLVTQNKHHCARDLWTQDHGAKGSTL